jgi:hypothetical protein
MSRIFLDFLTLVLTSPSFWVSPYFNYQEFLSQTITKFRDDNMTYCQISDWLNEEGYKTPRGKRFSGKYVFSIQKKKRILDKRISREVQPVLKKFDLKYFIYTEIRYLMFMWAPKTQQPAYQSRGSANSQNRTPVGSRKSSHFGT